MSLPLPLIDSIGLPAPSAGVFDPAAQEDLFGTDILFTDRTQLSADGDYATISGLDNLRRAVERRLYTRPGEYVFRPEYGVGVQEFIGRAESTAAADELRTRIINNLAQEKRIERVLSVEIDSADFGNLRGLIIRIFVEAIGKPMTLGPYNILEPGA